MSCKPCSPLSCALHGREAVWPEKQQHHTAVAGQASDSQCVLCGDEARVAMLVTITAGLSNATHIRKSLCVEDEIGVSGVLLLIPIKKVFHCPLSWTGFLLLAVPTQNACADARFPVWLDSSKKIRWHSSIQSRYAGRRNGPSAKTDREPHHSVPRGVRVVAFPTMASHRPDSSTRRGQQVLELAASSRM